MANYEEGYDVEYLEWVGGAEESVYSDESRADLVADDAISAEEDAFMKGYNQEDEVVEESY